MQTDTNPLDLTSEPAEIERYELREPPTYRFDANRREFVQVLGAGLVIAVAAQPVAAQRQDRQRGKRGSGKASERFHIGKDGVVTVLTSKVDVGQGSRTQIAQAAAEELRLPLSQINVLMADTAQCPDDGGTAGSRTTPSTVPAVRAASAAARQVLTDLAAKRLEAAAASLRFDGGKFIDDVGKRQVTLAELAADESFAAAWDRALPAGATITRVERWNVLGKSVSNVHGAAVVTGAKKFPSDITLPGMLHGKVLRAPTLGATLKSIDLMPARRIEGAIVVHDGNFVGCAAATSWDAGEALAALAAAAQWESTKEAASSDNLFEQLKSTAAAGGSGRGRENAWGDRRAALAGAKKKLEATYTIAYIQHAPMEPRAAVAQWQAGKLTVWTGTQQPSRVRGDLAQTFRLAAENVRVIVPDTGGGFGGKHTGEAAVEAARLAKAAGKPVSLRWTREEEFTWAYFRPAGLIEVQAALDEQGKLLTWDFTNYNSGGSAIDSPYRAPHGRTRFLSANAPLRQGSYRALASTANTFAREAAIDELAAAASNDPLEFRLAHLPAGRLKDVLAAVAKKFDWLRRRKERAAPRGIGIACGTEKGSFVATCAEVEAVDGKPRVLSLCVAYECGAIQNPANLRAQVVGSVVMGLGGALFEEIRFAGGQITNASFSDYRVPRMADVPPLDIELVDRRDLPSVGAGETPIIAVAPAIANAMADAGLGRIRSLPLRNEIAKKP